MPITEATLATAAAAAKEVATEVGKTVKETIKTVAIESKELIKYCSESSKNNPEKVFSVVDKVKEYKDSSFKNTNNDYLLSKVNNVKNYSFEQMSDKVSPINKLNINETNKYIGLTENEKIKIREDSGWSNNIINNIRSMKEYEIYKNAKLEYITYNNKDCLIKTDINWNQIDLKGKTNLERIKEGKSPLDSNNRCIELHHIGQHANSPLAELKVEEHRGKINDSILHDKTIQTETHGLGSNWDTEKMNYWKSRAEMEKI